MASSTLNKIILFLSCLGIFIAGNLSLSHVLNVELPCGAGGGCDKVLNDSWSTVAGIPIAYFGFFAYVVLAALTYLRAGKSEKEGKPLLTYGYLMTMAGAIVSVALQYHSKVDLGDFCKWCLASAVTMVLLFLCHLYMFLKKTPSEVPQESAEAAQESTKVAPSPVKGFFFSCLAVSVLGIAGLGAKLKSDAAASPTTGPLKIDKLMNKDVHFIAGDQNAPVTVIEFGDLMCHACRAHFKEVRGMMLQGNGNIRFGFRHFPLEKLAGHEMSLMAAVVSEMAAENNHFWDFLDVIYSLEDSAKDPQQVYQAFASVNGDVKKAAKRFSSIDTDPAFKRVMADKADGQENGVVSTPTFVIIVKGQKPEALNFQGMVDWFKEPEHKKLVWPNGNAPFKD